MTTSSTALAAEYRQTIVEWVELRSRPAKANRVFKKNHAIYKELRVTDEGRAAIQALLTNPIVRVRSLAATHMLVWAPDEAIPVLEDIAKVAKGEDYMAAVMVLTQFRAGELNLDW